MKRFYDAPEAVLLAVSSGDEILNLSFDENAQGDLDENAAYNFNTIFQIQE